MKRWNSLLLAEGWALLEAHLGQGIAMMIVSKRSSGRMFVKGATPAQHISRRFPTSNKEPMAHIHIEEILVSRVGD